MGESQYFKAASSPLCVGLDSMRTNDLGYRGVSLLSQEDVKMLCPEMLFPCGRGGGPRRCPSPLRADWPGSQLGVVFEDDFKLLAQHDVSSHLQPPREESLKEQV